MVMTVVAARGKISHFNFCWRYGMRVAFRRVALLFILASFAVLARAEGNLLRVEEPWVRATVASQQATGAFMQLTAREALTLVGARSPVAERTEIHVTEIVEGVMKMRPIQSLPMVAGELVLLKPGNLHIMLMGLKQPLTVGQKVPLVLIFENARGKRHELKINAEAKALAADHPAQGFMSTHKNHSKHP
jgi:copper(I)-binding protein